MRIHRKQLGPNVPKRLLHFNREILKDRFQAKKKLEVTSSHNNEESFFPKVPHRERRK